MFESIESSIQGKLEGTSKEFKSFFLLKFTKELIKNSETGQFLKLNKVIKKTEKEKSIVKKFKYKSEEFFPSLMYGQPKPQWNKVQENQSNQIFQSQFQNQPRRLPMQKRLPQKIPEYPLPPNLQYLQPVPTNIQIDLGKLNGITQDPNVNSIECNGPDEPVFVKGRMGTKQTTIMLNNEEINDVLNRFSTISRIPIHEGVFKIVVGKFILSAIISEVVGSKFIIRKITSQIQTPMPGIPSRFPPRY